jgi:hypothetical protein
MSVLGEEAAFPACITSLSGGGIIRVRVPQKLSEGRRIRVQAGPTYSATATVLYSVGSNNDYWATIKIDQDDRRDVRIAVKGEARVVLCDSSQTVVADVTDVSKSGLGFVTDCNIPRHVSVKIVLQGAVIFAETRYCQEVDGEGGGYKVGVEIKTAILDGEADPDWMHTPEELWGDLALAVRQFQGIF